MRKLVGIAFIWFILHPMLLAQGNDRIIYGNNRITFGNNRIIYGDLILFDNLFKNPAFTGDSTCLNSNLIMSWGGYTGFIGLFSVDKYFDKINSGLGARYVTQGTYSRSYEFLYSYSLTFNKLKLKFGTSLGLLRLKETDNSWSALIFPNERYHNKFLINIGALADLNNQRFGVSYINRLNNSTQNEDVLLIHYSTLFQISHSLKLYPELIDIYNVYRNSIILSLKLSCQEKFIIGYMNNSLQNSSYMLSYTLKKRYSFGLFLNYIKYFTDNHLSKLYGFMLNIKI
jgi:hypothetical protein